MHGSRAMRLMLVLILLVFTVAIAKKDARSEDRPKLIVSQTWEGDVVSEQADVKISFAVYNAGSLEARDIKITLPAVFDVAPLTIEALSPDARESHSIIVNLKEAVSLSAREAAARVEYHQKGSSMEFVGIALPAKDFKVLSASDFQSHSNKHYMEWTLYLLLAFGGGVGYPAFQYYRVTHDVFDEATASVIKKSAKKQS